ncbi:MAG: UDP-N-acetylmuramoyl-L-alanyl-D-glutamate--2,6-diaminopimelate ligase, partial [Deltaproteobacteria bacterium]|nr:UDP-N-acetylmuramoyl-L-alanyl-D-glutamate--2,6-diaminopimelate ligase [Deltaproteobacteria bacterium]
MKPINAVLNPQEILASNLDTSTPIAGLTQSSTAQSLDHLVFFAIKGSKFDGHDYAGMALAKGASAIVVERPEVYQGLERAILVKSTRETLANAASLWFDEPTKKLKLAGITGTNGKTTTAYLLKAIWADMGCVSGMVGTVQYHIGPKVFQSSLTTPDPLALQEFFSQMLSAQVTHAAMEVSSIAIDQKRMGGCHFAVGAFTNLTQDHLDYHQTMENYYLTKRKFFSDYAIPIAVYNVDDEWGLRLHKERLVGKPLTFSVMQSNADFFAENCILGRDGTQATIHTPLGKLELKTPLVGRHNVYNCLTALAIVYALNQDLLQAFESLSHASGAPGRLERVSIRKDAPQIFVDYAHTPDALYNVLTALRGISSPHCGRMITVFGCGGDRDKSKRPQMGRIVSSMSDITVATSDNPRTEDPQSIINDIEAGIDHEKSTYYRESNRKAAIELALSIATHEDFVLIAGKGHETY